MSKRSLFLTLAATFLVSGLGAFEARAGSLPTTGWTMAQILSGGTFSPFTVDNTANGGEVLTFGSFTYVPTPVLGSIPATAVTVTPFLPTFLPPTPAETGIAINAGFTANAGQNFDYAVSFVVTAPAGERLNDAYLLIAAAVTGTGTATVTETITNTATGAFLGTISATAGLPVATTSWTADNVTSITVTKDIDVVGGLNGTAFLSVVDQGFSSVNVIPEPTSLALLGIGMAGFFTYRRLFKRLATV